MDSYKKRFNPPEDAQANRMCANQLWAYCSDNHTTPENICQQMNWKELGASQDDSDQTSDSDTNDDDTCDSSVASIDAPQRVAPILQFISATTRVVDLTDPGELVDTGGNFCMCNDLTILVNVQPIAPFGISMAAVQDKTAPTCTHRGDFPIPMKDGSVYYTPMFYNPQASDCILSPQAICRDSMGYLTSWSQEGATTHQSGKLTIFNKHGAAVICLDLVQKNGLFYTTTRTMALDHPTTPVRCLNSSSIYLHTEEGIDDDASLDWDSSFDTQNEITPPESAQTNFYIRDPTSSPRRQQLEADLWQARLGHCGEWQLKVIPHAVDGTPTEFTPHPFSSYDHYDNRARIRKIPATKGKHPSRATSRQQRFYMDFGFLRASNFD
jgi:hypothetical protein